MQQRWQAIGKLFLRRWSWQARHRWERTPIGVRFAFTLTLLFLIMLSPWICLSLFHLNAALNTQARLTQMRQAGVAELIIERELMSLLRHGEDYSVWNDARRAMLQRDLEWFRTTTVDWLTQHFHYDIVAVLQADGQPLLSSEPDIQWLTRLPLVQDAPRGKGDAGLIRHGGTIYLVSATPICDEEWKYPSVGALILAKALNRPQLDRISEQIGNRVIMPPNVNPESIASSSAGTHGGAITLYDPTGTPIATLSVEFPLAQTLLTRELADSAKRYVVGFSIGIALVASLVLIWFLRAYIARFLTAIQRLASGDWETRIPYVARDEFGFLARTFNTMAMQLQQAFEEQERQRQEIQAQNEELHALYQQLQAAHQELAQLNRELVEANRLLAQAAVTDGLTGLKNHRAFQESLNNLVQMADRHQQPLSLIMLDIDHFKEFNDRFGHPAGDELLRQVAEVLRQSARAYDVAARYGGEEFALLLPHTTLEQAVQVAERLRHQIQAIKNPHAPVSASLGVASYRHGSAPATLLYEADAALYRAKRSGRNQVCVYHPEAA
ncbi:MAG: diguanylate cyclase [Fimbriimonadales bacterium]|nr:diguanylate cyclase [Fimbriimonadales bacterium]